MPVQLSKRYVILLISLYINALGISLVTKAMLGTSPITSVPYVMSMFTTLSMGAWTSIMNFLFILLEIPIMTPARVREDLGHYLMQIPNSIFFGLFIDINMWLLSAVNPHEYIFEILILVLGCVVMAIGISLGVKADVAMKPSDFFVRVLSRRLHRNFGYMKMGLDLTLVALACIISYIAMGEIRGIREGSIICAFLVGPIIHYMIPLYRWLDRHLTH